MVNAYLTSRNRLFALGALLLLSFAAAGRNVAQEERQEWPRAIDAAGSRISVFEPQIESLKGNKMSARAAISVVPESSTEPIYGSLWLEATLRTSPDGKTARPENIRVVEVRLPAADGKVPALRDAIGSEITGWNMVYNLDSVLAEIREIEERKSAAQAFKSEVPDINFRSHPAVMVTLDGDPEWRDVPGTGLRRIANSTFFVVEEADAGKCYLRIEPFWWTAASALGPWQAADDVPDAVDALWAKEPRPQVAGDADDREEVQRRPEVLTSTKPAELIWTDGLPQYAAIAGTDLLYVKNTSSDVFLEISTQTSYILISGRWYRTPSTRVAWEFVASDKLPSDFNRIPIGSEKQHVLACVAGTAQAREALKNAEIPQTEAVKPGPAPNLQATYDGEPRFTEVADSSVRYAVNSPSPIFNVDRRYYWCEDGIWYDSDYAIGPWSVCSYVPRPIYLIPPSCPFYYATYCRIFSVSPSSICFGYYPGYRGCYAWGPTVVYGTGWRYPWWVGSSCYIRPVTWGVGVRYSWSACSWTFGLGWGNSCAWGGVSTYRRAPSIVVGIGGGTNVRYVSNYRNGGYRNSVGVDVAVSARHARPDNLYVRQPERIVRQVPPQPETHPVRRPSIVKDPPVRRDPTTPGRDVTPRDPNHGRDVLRPNEPDHDFGNGRRPKDPNLTPDARRPKEPDNDPRDNNRNERRPKEPERTPRDTDRDDNNNNRIPRRDERDTPKPPPVERREPPRQPPPPPPVERREPPRQPPPPPPVERREPPRQPPPVERREPPRQPPPQQEHRRQPDRSNDRGNDRGNDRRR